MLPFHGRTTEGPIGTFRELRRYCAAAVEFPVRPFPGLSERRTLAAAYNPNRWRVFPCEASCWPGADTSMRWR
jgi:hypothetical protein